ncbi:MAG: hypothetical protein A3F12_07510 [Gammaproteobacteria bacterium RIFCSPHIGHO2_12_FULL_38_14]|nr:MAG: hypothetical protein A3F12_07510 [Gammaproteobacteria bacterium RIFCSPHIGHO2_12_FULL_38_14]
MRWILSFHIIFMVAWFAGLFYLPRLFMYHAMCRDDIGNQRFKVMEKKLYWMIMMPAAMLTVILGVWLLSFNWRYYLHSNWMLMKLICVFLLLGYHHACGKILKKFKTDSHHYSPLFFKVFNEVPTVLLILIVILVIVRP